MGKLKTLKKVIVPATMVTTILFVSSGFGSAKVYAETFEDKRNGITTHLESDKDLKSLLEESSVKKMIELSREGKDISILIKGEERILTTSSNNVKDILEEAGIALHPKDETYPSLNSEIKDGGEILVIKFEEEFYDEIKEIKFDVIEEFSFEIPYGEKKVVQEGENGEKKLSFKQELKNGIIISDEKYSEKTIKAPIDKKILIGTKEKIEEEIDFEIETKENNSMFKGESKVIQSGKKGEREKTYNNDGIDRKLISDIIISNPKNQIVEVGTKDRPKVLMSEKTTNKYSLSDFKFRGVIHDNGLKYTYYSQSVLPGKGLKIPGRHVNSGGYVADSNGYIVLAAGRSVSKGTVINTPFGYQGKVYDTCASCDSTWFDVYIK